MAIRMSIATDTACNALAAGALNITEITDYPGLEAGRISHWDYGDTPCPHAAESAYARAKGPNCNECCREIEPLYMETEYAGMVVGKYERNGYDDSDFIAVVWDPETGAPFEVCYASTRGWTYANSANIDATPEVKAKYDAWLAARAKSAEDARAARIAATPAKGKTLKVVAGRKVPKGTLGVCIWAGTTRYGERVGLKDADGEVFWTAAKNVAVVL